MFFENRKLRLNELINYNHYLLSIRGSIYLNDKIKIKLKQASFNIGHIECI